LYFPSEEALKFIGLPRPCKIKQCGEFDEFACLKLGLGAKLPPESLN
jgi:hypothetical protein